MQGALRRAAHDAAVVAFEQLTQVAASGRGQPVAADDLVAEGRRDARRGCVGEPFEDLGERIPASLRRLGQSTRAPARVGSAWRLTVLVPFQGTPQRTYVVASPFPAAAPVDRAGGIEMDRADRRRLHIFGQLPRRLIPVDVKEKEFSETT